MPENQQPEPLRFLLLIDNLLELEYIEQAERSRASDPENLTSIIIEKILKGSSLFVKKLSGELSAPLAKRFKRSGCPEVEKQMFGLAELHDANIVCPDHSRAIPVPRVYLGQLDNLQRGGIGPAVLTLAEILGPIREPGPYSPSTIDDLRVLICKWPEEEEFTEFKSPEDDYLTSDMRNKVVKAICGLLNTRSGWVFIGVTPNGAIAPFSPRYGSLNKDPSTDQLLRDILQQIGQITPKPGRLVIPWPILNDKLKCVVVIYVHQGKRTYLYRGKKWIRLGPQTVEDPNWSPHS
jgi:hypothetical protein